MKILLIIVLLALFLVNPIAGLVGLSIVLLAIMGYVLFRGKMEKELKKEKDNSNAEDNSSDDADIK